MLYFVLASDGEALNLKLFSVSQHIAKHGFSVRSSVSNIWSDYPSIKKILASDLVMVIRCCGIVSVLTLFSVEHTNALDRAVIGNTLAELPSTGQSNHLGAV
jgi:hypothetical protein